MPSIISCYDINVCTKVLYSILARFLLVENPKLKASFVWASSNLIFELSLSYFIFAMLDATDSYVKSENLYQPKFDPFFKDQTILSISGATPQYWYMYCVGPTMAPHTFIEQNGHQYSWLI